MLIARGQEEARRTERMHFLKRCGAMESRNGGGGRGHMWKEERGNAAKMGKKFLLKGPRS